jgi:hypothetical protein
MSSRFPQAAMLAATRSAAPARLRGGNRNTARGEG